MLGLAVRTPGESFFGILQQLAASAAQFAVAFVSAAVKLYHEAHRALFVTYA